MRSLTTLGGGHIGLHALLLYISFAAAIAQTPPEVDVGLARPDIIGSVSNVSAQQIQRAMQPNSEDILRSIPGVFVSRAGGAGQSSFVFIRGASSEGTLVLIDGIPINDPSLTNRAFDFSTITLANVERVEVWKGPQSVLFGQGATGGAINLVTKRGYGPLSTKVDFEAGSFNTGLARAMASGSTSKVDYSIGVDRLQTNGYSAASKLHENAERDASTGTAVATRLGFALSSKLRLETLMRWTYREADLDYAPTNAAPFVLADAPNYRSTGQALALALDATYAWNKPWTSNVKLGRSTQVRRYKDDPSAGSTASLRSKYVGEIIHLENVNRFRSGDFDLAFGPSADFENSAVDSWSDTADYSVPHKHIASVSWFQRLQWERGKLFAQAGFRSERHRRYGSANSFELGPGMHLSSTTEIKLRWATGFKAPTLFQLYDPKFGNANLQPEHAEALELTLERFLFGRKCKLAATGFMNQTRSQIQFSQSSYSNVGVAEAQGLEFEIALRLAATTFHAGYTYLETRDRATALGLIRRPRNSLAAKLEVQLTDQWRTTFEFQTVDHRLDLDPVTHRTMITASYEMINASVFWEASRRWQFSLRAVNLLDRRFEEIAGYSGTPLGIFVGGTFRSGAPDREAPTL